MHIFQYAELIIEFFYGGRSMNLSYASTTNSSNYYVATIHSLHEHFDVSENTRGTTGLPEDGSDERRNASGYE